jgi:tetratricopeptide (TPR) repeat protein/tRNA A-37 threonylcarbamoyl transferase component Bud32
VERPRLIGPFTVLDVLGEGGMGTVYLAEQTSPIRRKVALKLIRAGAVDAERLARFATEREALARMNHPNIAQVYTAGTSRDGQPWIAMEYVPGVPITDFCDDRRWSIARRVSLFVTVCDAIQHAHQKALLHRDLKPSNVLVAENEGGALAKVIDFGVAKALDGPGTGGDSKAATALVGTPTYLAPEALAAARGEADVDTRSDVYGLGLLLFELLVGEQPFGTVSNFAAMRRIVEGDVPRPSAYLQKLSVARCSELAAARGADPSAHRRALRNDLDWIVLKAMAREPDQRYGSAAELADDLRRSLDLLPVRAGAPGAWYRLRKFGRRHRAAVAGAALVALALVGGIVARSREATRANREAARANQEAQTASEVSQFLIGLFQGSDPGRNTRPDITAREILDRGAERVRGELSSQPLVKARLLNAIAVIYRQLGLLDQAIELGRESLALADRPEGGGAAETAEALLSLGTAYEMRGDAETSEPLLRRAEAGFAALGDGVALAACRMQLASAAGKRRRFDLAEQLSLEAIRGWEATLGPDSERIGAALNNLANLYYDQKRWSEAESAHLRAIAIKRKVFGEEHYYVAQSLSNLANVYIEQGRLAEAEDLAQHALAIKRRVLAPDHFEIGVSLHNLGDVALKAGRPDRAAERYAEAVAFWEAIGGAGKGFVSYSLTGLAHAERDRGHYAEAARLYAQALARTDGRNEEVEREIAIGREKLAKLAP